MLLYRHPRIEVIVAGGAVRRADRCRHRLDRDQPDRPVQGRLRHHRRLRDRRRGGAIGLRLSRGAGGAAGHHRQRAQCHAGRRFDQTAAQRAGPHRHISQIQTFVTDVALPAGLANVCHSRGIEVIEAMRSRRRYRRARRGARAAGVGASPALAVRVGIRHRRLRSRGGLDRRLGTMTASG